MERWWKQVLLPLSGWPRFDTSSIVALPEKDGLLYLSLWVGTGFPAHTFTRTNFVVGTIYCAVTIGGPTAYVRETSDLNAKMLTTTLTKNGIVEIAKVQEFVFWRWILPVYSRIIIEITVKQWAEMLITDSEIYLDQFFI